MGEPSQREYQDGEIVWGPFADRLQVMMLDQPAEVNAVAAGIGHHQLTGHDGSGDGECYYCDGCDFEIVDSRVWCSGPIGVRVEEDTTNGE